MGGIVFAVITRAVKWPGLRGIFGSVAFALVVSLVMIGTSAVQAVAGPDAPVVFPDEYAVSISDPGCVDTSVTQTASLTNAMQEDFTFVLTAQYGTDEYVSSEPIVVHPGQTAAGSLAIRNGANYKFSIWGNSSALFDFFERYYKSQDFTAPECRALQAGAVSISPDPVGAGTVTFTATPAGFDDANGGVALTYHYEWTYDGSPVGTDAAVLPDLVVAKGKAVAVSVTATDGVLTSSAATDSVLVGDPPFAANPDSYTTLMGTKLLVGPRHGILANDNAPGKTTLTVKHVNGTFVGRRGATVGTGHGKLTLKTDGSFTYQPQRGYRGLDTFTYVASDGTSSMSATATIRVDATPIAKDDRYSVTLHSILTVAASGVLTNDLDADGDTLRVSAVNGRASGIGRSVTTARGGGITVKADGSMSYKPGARSRGIDWFTYTVSDGFASSTAVVWIRVS